MTQLPQLPQMNHLNYAMLTTTFFKPKNIDSLLEWCTAFSLELLYDKIKSFTVCSIRGYTPIPLFKDNKLILFHKELQDFLDENEHVVVQSIGYQTLDNHNSNWRLYARAFYITSNGLYHVIDIDDIYSKAFIAMNDSNYNALESLENNLDFLSLIQK